MPTRMDADRDLQVPQVEELAPSRDRFSKRFVPQLIVTGTDLAVTLQTLTAIATPGSSPRVQASVRMRLAVDGIVEIVIEATPDPENQTDILVTASCPKRPEALLRRRYNLLAALDRHLTDVSKYEIPVQRSGILASGAVVLVLPIES